MKGEGALPLSGKEKKESEERIGGEGRGKGTEARGSSQRNEKKGEKRKLSSSFFSIKKGKDLFEEYYFVGWKGQRGKRGPRRTEGNPRKAQRSEKEEEEKGGSFDSESLTLSLLLLLLL